MGKDSLEKKGFQILGRGFVAATDVIDNMKLSHRDGAVVGVGLASSILALGVRDTLVGVQRVEPYIGAARESSVVVRGFRRQRGTVFISKSDPILMGEDLDNDGDLELYIFTLG